MRVGDEGLISTQPRMRTTAVRQQVPGPAQRPTQRSIGMPNFQRRVFAVLALALAASFMQVARAADPQAYDEKAFRVAQSAGKAVLVDIFASW